LLFIKKKNRLSVILFLTENDLRKEKIIEFENIFFMLQHSKYNGEIVAGSLLISESRQIARLLLDGADDKKWHRKIVVENILQKKSPKSSVRQARLIRNRLSMMNAELWKLIINGSFETATQAILAASIKHNHLIGDFMDNVIRQHWQTFKKHISVKDWEDFLRTCAQIESQSRCMVCQYPYETPAGGFPDIGGIRIH
jgi:hypothetical protein